MGCSRRPSDLGQILISLASAPAPATPLRSELHQTRAGVRESGSGLWSSQFLGASPWVIFKMSVVPSCLINLFFSRCNASSEPIILQRTLQSG